MAGLASVLSGCLIRHEVIPPEQAQAMIEKQRAAGETPKIVPAENSRFRRKPTASTCVTIAEYREAAAADSGIPPAQVDSLREEARKLYQQALTLDAKYLPAYRGLARLYEARGDYERAVATYQAAIKKHPKEASLWFDLGMCQARRKDWEPSLASLRKAVELDPENRIFCKTLGLCLARAGRYDESFNFLKGIVGEAQAHYDLARMLLHLNEPEGAQRHLTLALQVNPEMEAAQELLANLNGQGAPSPSLGNPLAGLEPHGN